MKQTQLEEEDAVDEDLVVIPTQEEEMEMSRAQGLIGSGGEMIEFENFEKSEEQQRQQNNEAFFSFL